MNANALEEILGGKGQVQDQIVKFSFGREAEMHGTVFGNSMGLNTWMAFAGTDQMAVVDGDFAMHGSEVQSVLKALRQGGIYIVALHNHMVGETPAYFFVHFWGKGNPQELAKTLKTAIDLTR